MMSWPVVNAAPGELSQSTGVIHDGSTTGPKHDRDLVLHQQQHAADVNIADLMVVLDRLLGDEQAELALGAGVVERDVQRPEGADGLFDERNNVILPTDISLHIQGTSTG
jgi:hypothetical protein